jgi:hypothetical protein
MSDEQRAVLQRVVTQLRTEHRNCRYGTTVCNLGGCPWPVMFDEDVTELYQRLTEAGYEITKVGA